MTFRYLPIGFVLVIKKRKGENRGIGFFSLVVGLDEEYYCPTTN